MRGSRQPKALLLSELAIARVVRALCIVGHWQFLRLVTVNQVSFPLHRILDSALAILLNIVSVHDFPDLGPIQFAGCFDVADSRDITQHDLERTAECVGIQVLLRCEDYQRRGQELLRKQVLLVVGIRQESGQVHIQRGPWQERRWDQKGQGYWGRGERRG